MLEFHVRNPYEVDWVVIEASSLRDAAIEFLDDRIPIGEKIYIEIRSPGSKMFEEVEVSGEIGIHLTGEQSPEDPDEENE